MRRRRNSVTFSFLLIITDMFAILVAYSLAYIFRVKLSNVPIHETTYVAAWPYFLSLLAILPFIVLFFSLIGSYNSQPQKKLVLIARIITGAFGVMLLLVTLDYFYYEPIFPAKLIPLYALLFSMILLIIARGTLYSIRWYWWRRTNNLQRVLVVGDNQVASDIVRNINNHGSGYKLQAVIGDMRLRFTTHNSFTKAVRNQKPHIIIQVATPSHPVINGRLFNYALQNYAEFKFVPSDVSSLPDRIELELFMGEIPLLNVQQTALIGWNRVLKRLFDILASAFALIILSPLIAIVSLINILVFGKIFFSQNRLTRNNKRFKLFKFQTVTQKLNGLTPEEAFKKIGRPDLIKKYRDNGDFLENDPRYNKWAMFLRKTSIDELPQLWNVLKGDISLIGPRALIPEELESYHEKHVILNVKSGVTGLAQISGRRDLPWQQRRKLDIYYVQNWSFGLDIQILLTTVWQIITGRGAR